MKRWIKTSIFLMGTLLITSFPLAANTNLPFEQVNAGEGIGRRLENALPIIIVLTIIVAVLIKFKVLPKFQAKSAKQESQNSKSVSKTSEYYPDVPVIQKYNILIKRIKYLATNYDNSGNNNEFPNEITQTQNSFQITFLFNRSQSFSINKDTFELWEEPNSLIINWQRISQNKTSLFTSDFPSKINNSWKFNKSEDQEYIYKTIIADINTKFKKYHFSDSIYTIAQMTLDS